MSQHDQFSLTRRAFLALSIASAFCREFWQDVMAAAADGEIPRRVLGGTGEKVSILGLGGYHIGSPPDENEGIRIIRTAIDNSVNFMDYCWDYHGGNSEVRMGKALQGGYRSKVFLMTKIDGRDKNTAASQIDDSLRRLQTDTIDLMQLHEVIRMSDAEKSFGPNGAMEALVDAKKAGKIRYIGFTGHKSPELHLHMLACAARNNFRFDAVQLPLNVMDTHFDSFEKLVVPVLVKHQIGVLGMKPLGAGLILRSGVISASECLQYAMDLPTTTVITGCESMTILRQALRAARSFRPLTTNERNAIMARTRSLASNGDYELYKTTERFDGTSHHPEWMG
jgi:aryl-alcohol dehydrogenase-like predicted oxidoreductase